jgi:hypothetical protein
MHDFDRTAGAEGIPRQPHFAAAAAPDEAQQFVIWNNWNGRCFRHIVFNPLPLFFEQTDFLLDQRQHSVLGEINLRDIDS